MEHQENIANFPPPIGYRGVDTDRPPGRPAAVTVIAILGIVYGLFEVWAFALVSNRNLHLLHLLHSRGNAHFTFFSFSVPAMSRSLIFSIGIYAIGILVALWLVAASIAALRLASWARRGMLGWAAARLILVIAAIGVHVSYLSAMATPRQGVPQSIPTTAYLWHLVRWTLLDLPSMLGLILAVFTLVLFTRRRVKAAFAVLRQKPIWPGETGL